MAAIVDCWNFTEQLQEDSDEFRRYYQAAVDSLKESLDILHEKDFKTKSDWIVEGHSADKHDHVYSTKHHSGKVLVFEGNINCSVDDLFRELWHFNCELPQYNPEGCTECWKVLQVGQQSDVNYVSSPVVFGGLVSARESVDARCWRKLGNVYCIGHRSVECPKISKKKDKIRTHTHQNLMRISPVDGHSDCATLLWLVQTDLKGMIPKSIAERATVSWLLNNAKLLRGHLKDKQTKSSHIKH